jgi:hypothetical protein
LNSHFTCSREFHCCYYSFKSWWTEKIFSVEIWLSRSKFQGSFPRWTYSVTCSLLVRSWVLQWGN